MQLFKLLLLYKVLVCYCYYKCVNSVLLLLVCSTVSVGWLTVGPDMTSSNFSKEHYLSFFDGPDGNLLGHSDEIETRRPKTPPLKPRGTRGGRGGVTRGAMGMGRGVTPTGRGGAIGRTF